MSGSTQSGPQRGLVDLSDGVLGKSIQHVERHRNLDLRELGTAAREQGILTIGVVTKPFHFEGRRRMQSAEQGISELEKVVDTLIVIPNQNLFKIANEKTTFADAFKMADDVLHMGVRGVTDLMVMPGLINLDFADIRTVMGEMGKAMMGTGEAEGQDRSRVAAESAISNPLLEDHSMKGAKGVLINITGGMVIMRINLTNDFPDFSRAVNGNPSINTQRASTEVQVADGMTTVIGGINQSKENTKNDQTPGVGNLPLLGWLFKRNEVSSENQELFIFITPRVVQGRP